MEQNEVDLLRRARQLEEAALATIHDEYYPRILRYVRLRVADQETAEDITSDVFMRFLQVLRDRNRPPNTIRGWLFGAANMVLKEHYRHKKRANLTPLEDKENVLQAANNPEAEVAKLFNNEQLGEAIAQLSDEQQQVIGLRFGYEMPIREVADVINKSEGAVKMLQVRAIASLSRLMQQMVGGES